MTVSVVLADDSLIVREGVPQLLSAEPGIELVAVCEDRDSLERAIEDHLPDVVVTDIRMPPTKTDEGIQVAARLRDEHPEIGVVVLSNYADPMYALALLKSGAERRAYLLKERIHDSAQLLSAIYAVASGGSVLDSKIVEPLVAARGLGGRRSVLADLTPREREVLSEIAQGKSNAAIASAMALTKRAVEKHVGSIFLKLNLTDEEDVSRRVMAALAFLAEVDVTDP
jgi:DNA-binding NarL/FixJ family response regulator